MGLPSICMRFITALLILGQHQSSHVSAQGMSRLMNGFIVEYADVPGALDVDILHQNVLLQVEESTGGAMRAAHKLDLRSSLFNGASFRLMQSTPTPEQAAANLAKARKRSSDGSTVDDVLVRNLMQMPTIAAVHVNHVHYLQSPMETPGQVFSREEMASLLERRKDAPANSSEEKSVLYLKGTPLINPHSLTGVDKLHLEGMVGAGIKIAVIDNGIDPSHPALGGGFGSGFKVEGGYDFVGDQPNNDVDPLAPDDSPITVCANHGTAVSSIAAGMPYKYGFVGVAPNATLLMYKVFPCSGGASTDVGVNASLAAYEAGADVINASIGSQGGWSESLWNIIAKRIMDKGTPYLIAAGNDGARGAFIANSLNGGFGVPSVGSVDNAYTTALIADGSYKVNNATPVAIKYSPGFPANWTNFVSETAPLTLFLPPSVNGCIPYPKNTTYSNNSVVLLPRQRPGVPAGSCPQGPLLKAAGIRKFLVYNYADEQPLRPLPLVTTEGFPFDFLDATADIDHALGVELSKLLTDGATVELDLPWRPSNDTRAPRVQPNFSSAGKMSNYSTWGPTYEAKIGTTFSAPGGLYVAAGATIYGGFVIASGTSFASPYAAGAAALIKQAHRNLTAYEVINRLATTAKPVQMQSTLRETQDYLAPTFQQGGGLIDVYAALHTTTTFNVSELAFNDTAYIQAQSFEMYNSANQSVTYTITHTPGPSMYTFSPNNITVDAFSNNTAFLDNMLPNAQATLEFSTNTTLSLGPGGSAVVRVTAIPPRGLDTSRLPLYSGFVSIAASNNFNLSIPYGGIAAPLRSVRVLDSSPGQERTVLIANASTSTDGPEAGVVRPGLTGNNLTRSFTIPRLEAGGNISTETALWNVTLPGFSVDAAFGSRRAEVKLMENGVSLGAIMSITVEGQVPLTETVFSRNAPLSLLFYGMMADGSFVKAGGPYRFNVRLLRITGDPAKAEDWDEAVTESFELQYAKPGSNSTATAQQSTAGQQTVADQQTGVIALAAKPNFASRTVFAGQASQFFVAGLLGLLSLLVI